MNSNDRNKLIHAGYTVLRVQAELQKITMLSQSGAWIVHSKYDSKSALARGVTDLRGSSEKLIFETDEQDLNTVSSDVMTEPEAREKHEQLKAIHQVARSRLLEMRDRKGWQALGFTSFEDYGEKEWNYSQSYIYRLSKAEEIQVTLSPIGEIPEAHLRPLGAVPAEERQAIFDEANRAAEAAGQKRTAKMVKDAVKVYQDKLQALERRSDDLENEFDSLVEKQVNEQLEEKQQELQVNLNHALEQTQGDYQSKIDDQKDIIARLQGQLNRLNASDDIAASQQLIAINQQIASQQAALTGLQQQYDDTAARLVIDDGFADTADHLSKEVSAFIKELLISYSGDKAIYPQAALSGTNKNKMLHAARAFRDACDDILNLHWEQK
jgi:hypothetical protein